MLTIKQEKFIQNIVQGMSQREAYKNSYNANNMKDSTIDKKASELFQKGEIRGRYEELLKKIEDKTIMTAEERQIWLSKVVKGDIKITREYEDEIKEYEPYMSDRLKAMDILNKMSGEYTQKIELENEKPFEVNIKVV